MSRLTFLVTVITLTCTGVILASGVKSQNLKEVKISVDTKGTVLKEILTDLEKKSGFSFVYSPEVGNIANIRLSGKTSTLYDVLKEIAQQKKLRFNQESYLIAVVKSPPQPVPPQPGKIYGKVVDDKGESLPGANIRIVELNIAAASAVDGSYNINAAPGTYTVEVSYISFQTKRIADVIVKSDGLTKLDVVLLTASNALNAVMITSTYKKESAAGLYATQKNAASMTDGISAEQIARTPDNNMGQVLKRISGVTTVDNRYIVVRGLTERYNQGMIDGVVLPSTDMNRRNFSFDVIPVEMVSNVVVNKTATPDVSAEFAGGQVSVNTLDIPLENFTIVAAGTGFNSYTLGKTFKQAGKRGKYDFMAFDDGHRKLPAGIQAWKIGGNTPPPDFAGPQSRLFSADAFKVYKLTGDVNQNYRFSVGRVYDLKENQKWGFVAGLSLRNSQETNDYQSVRNMNRGTVDENTGRLESALIDTAYGRRNGHIYQYNSSIGAQLNAGIQGKTYKIGLKNVYSQIFTNSFNTSDGSRQIVQTINQQRDQSNLQDPKITRVLQHKLEGEHSLTSTGLKLTWFVSRTTVRQENKDNVKFNYRLTGEKNGIEYFQDPNVVTPGSNETDFDYRMFTDTRETDYNWTLNLSQSFNFLGDKSLIKGGYNGYNKKRTLDATQLYIYSEDRNFNNFSRRYEDIMSPENVGTGENQAYYLPAHTNGRQFDGKANFSAGYLMLDQHFLNKIRIVYGMRIEGYNMENKQSDVYANSTTRPVTGEDNITYLPSANLTYSITPKINFRASFAKTIIRPDFRETSAFGFWDVDLNAIIVGSDLVSTKIKNVDVRLEWYPSAGEIISVSGFHKLLDKPIELVADQDPTGSGKITQYSLQNQTDAVNYGGEIEIRKSLGFIADKQWLRNFSLFGNGTLIKSKINTLTKLGGGTFVENKETRALYGQSPFVINAGVSYTSADYGLTVNYNRSGRRTYTISTDPGSTEYENGRDQVDLQLFYRLLKRKIEVKLNIGNLLNTTSFFYINNNGYQNRLPTGNGTDSYESAFDDVRYRIKYGVTSNFSITYKF